MEKVLCIFCTEYCDEAGIGTPQAPLPYGISKVRRRTDNLGGSMTTPIELVRHPQYHNSSIYWNSEQQLTEYSVRSTHFVLMARFLRTKQILRSTESSVLCSLPFAFFVDYDLGNMWRNFSQPIICQCNFNGYNSHSPKSTRMHVACDSI